MVMIFSSPLGHVNFTISQTHCKGKRNKIAGFSHFFSVKQKILGFSLFFRKKDQKKTKNIIFCLIYAKKP
tara:strand:- start:48 stop:257 length:210 start_codon:yes stop_codon:yes gene_type:complete